MDDVKDDSAASSPGVTTKTSARSVPGTVERLLEMIDEHEMTVFAVIDHSGGARKAGLHLRETVLVIFGDPRGGTPAMVVSPLAGLDLPLKVLVWADGEVTRVSYNSPGYLADRHRLPEDAAALLAGIETLTDALVAI